MNILYLTSEYKDFRLGKNDAYTYISNSFCREWVKQGHNVVVIHNTNCFPKIIYYAPKLLKQWFELKAGFTWGSYQSVKKDEYYDDDVYVYRLPIKKYIPHQSPTEKQLDRQVIKIVEILKNREFEPDAIIGQWISPQMELIYRLKEKYDCPTSVVLHGSNYLTSEKFQVKKYLEHIDYLGARSEKHAEEVNRLLNLGKPPFVCYSGLPNEYIKAYKKDLKKFDNIKKWKFAFVGRLVEYKKADVLIKALSTIKDVDWELNVLGEGAQLPELKQLCKEIECENKVHFYGKVDRDEVLKILSESHCFVMVSVGEVFGLVYLEAVGACCITVASKGGGIDGVIKNAENGYLIDEGNEQQLSELLNKIVRMDSQELKKIASKGYDTAIEFSESKVAKKYLESAVGDQNSSLNS